MGLASYSVGRGGSDEKADLTVKDARKMRFKRINRKCKIDCFHSHIAFILSFNEGETATLGILSLS